MKKYRAIFVFMLCALNFCAFSQDACIFEVPTVKEQFLSSHVLNGRWEFVDKNSKTELEFLKNGSALLTLWYNKTLYSYRGMYKYQGDELIFYVNSYTEEKIFSKKTEPLKKEWKMIAILLPDNSLQITSADIPFDGAGHDFFSATIFNRK